MRIATPTTLILLLALLSPAALASDAPTQAERAPAEIICDEAGLPAAVCALIDKICSLIERAAQDLEELLPPDIWDIIEPLIDYIKRLCQRLR